MSNALLNRMGTQPSTNDSGGDLPYGAVVIAGGSGAKSFITSTTEGYNSSMIGVIVEPAGIADGETGLVSWGLWTPRINLDGAASLYDFIKHDGVAGQGTPHAAPMQAGDFALALEASANPSALLLGAPVPSTVAPGTAAITGTFALSGDISPSQITANQDNYNPTGLSGASVLRLSSDASRDVTGLQGGSDGRVLIVHNVGAQNIVLKDEAAGSTAGNRFALAADLTLSADSVIVLQYDSTSSRWRAIGGAGSGSGGAPTTAGYIVTAADGTLSAEVVIPGLAGSPDRSAIGGAGFSHEFDSGASPFTWSAAIDAEAVNSGIPSHLTIQDNGAAETFGTLAWAPAGAFDIRIKLSMGSEIGTGAGTPAVGLIVGDSAMNNRLLIELEYPGANDRFIISAYTYASSTLTQRGASILHTTNFIYLRIVRDGSNNNSFYFSNDGLTWTLIATQALTFTAAKAGIRMAANSVVTNAAIDWIRANV